MFTLIENGEVFGPEPQGKQSILLAAGKIAKIGEVDRGKLLSAGIECEVIEAEGCVITPGFIDPHEHLIGAGGEEGYASRMPEVPFEEIVRSGITTVVGCLGTDTSSRHLSSLLAQTCQLTEKGLTAYMYTGGFQVPTPTVTDSILNDLTLIDRIIGVGEIAISDTRSVEPTLAELARLISATLTGGMLGGKAGVTHFHVGPGKRRLKLLNELLDNYELPAEKIYPTHITRTPELMDEAIALTRRGSYVDIDTVEEDLGKWLRYYREHDGPFDHLTVSSDAHTAEGKPRKLYQQFISCQRDYGFTLKEILPLFTLNPAQVLQFKTKGRLQPGADGDLLVLKKKTLEIMHVFGRGGQLLRNGKLVTQKK